MSAGTMSRRGYRTSNGLLRDEAQRWNSAGALALQLGKQPLDLAPGSNGHPAFVASLFDLHLVQVPQIKQHVIGNHRLAPGMESADGPNTMAATLGHDCEQLLFRPWRVNRSGLKPDVATKVLDDARSQNTPMLVTPAAETVS
jgi:hypothetical protein